MANLVYTCLPATPEQAAQGFNVIVAHNETRVVEAGFRDGKYATAFCEKLNSVLPNEIHPLQQTATATVVKAPEGPKT